MLTEKNGPARGGSLRQGVNKWTYNDKLPLTRQKVNNNHFLVFHEKLQLVHFLVFGKYPSEFVNMRHRVIASCLECFLDNFPREQHTSRHFIFYLEENQMLEACGGAAYVESIFQGVDSE